MASYRLSCGYVKPLRTQPLERDFLEFLRKSCFNKNSKTVPKGLHLTLKTGISTNMQRGS